MRKFSFVPIALACISLQDPDAGSLGVDVSKLPAPTEEQSLALETLNGFRFLHGLEPVKMDRRLNASAAMHVKSMVDKNVLTHKGDKSSTEDATKRAQNFGYDKLVSELVAMGVPDSAFAVVTFVDAPYHRRLLLKPGPFDFGCFTKDKYSCFVLGGSPTQKVVLSPPANSEGVPPSWDGREDPDPMRGTGLKAPYGYPILIAAYGYSSKIVLNGSKVTDSNGKVIDCVVRQPQNDQEAKDSVIIIPKKPLAAKAVYTVSVQFALGEETRSETWSFRTGAAQ